MTVADNVPSIVERYPVNEWPVGPPHEFSPAKDDNPNTPCAACGAIRSKAIHSEAFWRQYDRVPGPFPSATDYIEWKNQ